ncbi:MAG TPA: aminotransferase class V-fold PLP-dependent enzyme, partial [bacterium]|nr:aminotransferase class V-fold PLP-dependent enzyme [bacterium]
MQVYLDNAATTRIDPRVLARMKPYFLNHFGNASSIHKLGQDNDAAIKKCKIKIGQLLGVKPERLVFTASATEANNFIIKGVMRANRERGNHLIISAIEHPCVRQSAKELEDEGFKVDIAPVDSRGLIDLGKLKNLIGPQTVLVS